MQTKGQMSRGSVRRGAVYFMGIRNDCRNQFCKKTRTQSIPQNLPHFRFPHSLAIRNSKQSFKLLVQNPLNCTLTHAQITRAQSPAQAPNPLGAPNLEGTIDRTAIPSGAQGGFIELETRFDNPDWVCCCAGDNTSEDCRGEGDGC